MGASADDVVELASRGVLDADALGPETVLEVDRRDADALTRYMTVLDEHDERVRGADDLYLVVSDSGREYLVDARGGACECPDAEYRGVECIHQKRVAYATGERDLPAWIDLDRVDDRLGEHVDGPDVLEAAREAREVAADD